MGIEQSLMEIQLNHYRMVVRTTTLSNAITSLKKNIVTKLVLYISRPFSKFTVDLSQESVFIDRFHRIDPTKTYNFFAPTLVTSASHKITAKCCILCPKTLLLPEKQLHAIHFFVVTCNVCPLAIP